MFKFFSYFIFLIYVVLKFLLKIGVYFICIFRFSILCVRIELGKAFLFIKTEAALARLTLPMTVMLFLSRVLPKNYIEKLTFFMKRPHRENITLERRKELSEQMSFIEGKINEEMESGLFTKEELDQRVALYREYRKVLKKRLE